MAQTAIPTASEPPHVGNHPALDFLNTTVMLEGTLVDLLASDEDVLQWLATMGFGKQKPTLTAGILLKQARAIREALRRAVEQKKTGEPISWRYWNTLLSKSPSHLVIQSDSSGTVRRWGSDTAEQILGPIIDAAVNLLLEGDFELIRNCEDGSCVLWFYDRTKSHRRRWCSMATCGNRNKVAAHRERAKSLT